MKELSRVRDAVVTALNAAGITAVAAWPAERVRAWPGAVAAVDVGTAEGGPMCFCNYLGEVWDPEAGTVREVYGKQLEAEILVDVRAVPAAACEESCEKAAEVLLWNLPEGLRTGELVWEGLSWERESRMFLRRGRLRCRAVFVARSRGEETAFLDFRLKGEVSK